jgi:hypothetical protein
MNTTRFTAAQRHTLEGNGPLVTCDVRTARVLQERGLLGPALGQYRRTVTAKLVSGPLLPDGVMRR